MVSLSPEIPFSIATRLVEQGAIMTLPGVPLIRHTVGGLRWLSKHDVLWLPLDAGPTVAARQLQFERMSSHIFGVCFERGSDVVALLTPIEKSAVENPAEFRRAFQQWQSRSETSRHPSAWFDRISQPGLASATRLASSLRASL